MDDSRHAPDWVMLGTPTGDGRIALYASKELTQAELARETDYPDPWVTSVRLPTTRITFTVQMRNYVMVVADTYAEAFQHLFATWSPEPERKSIDPTQQAIKAG